MRNYLLINLLQEIVASKVEKRLVIDHLQELKKEYEKDNISIADRYSDLKKFKLPSNTTVICLNCLSVRHKRTSELCCEESPEYDLTSSYRIILDYIENGVVNGKSPANK